MQKLRTVRGVHDLLPYELHKHNVVVNTGLEISDNHITHDEIGNHSVYAEYTINGQIYITEEIDYSVVNPVNKVLMEDFTGTWCGYCPPVKLAIEQARQVYPENISVVATHQK